MIFLLKKGNIKVNLDKKFSVNDSAFTDKGYLFNSKFLNDLKVPDESIPKTIEYLENNNIGVRKINYRLKDWGISRQRYWGCPIPIAYDENGNPIKIPKDMLPVKLPEIDKFETSGNPLDHLEEWKNISIDGKNYEIDRYCPHNGADLKDARIDNQGHLICPRHSWLFNLQNKGECTTADASLHAKEVIETISLCETVSARLLKLDE